MTKKRHEREPAHPQELMMACAIQGHAVTQFLIEKDPIKEQEFS
jgi:hypothetical protein